MSPFSKNAVKAILLAGSLLASYSSMAQAPEFSDRVKGFIDYDQSSILIQNALLFDGTGAPRKANQDVFIQNGKIAAVGDHGSLSTPQGVTILDASGKTLLPGLVMLHEHMYYTSSTAEGFTITENPRTFPRLYLAGGVTTARTGGSIEPFTDLSIRDAVKAGQMAGPDIDATAPYIEGKDSRIFQLARLDGIEAARKSVAYWADMGFTSFKAYMALSQDQMKAAVDEAHKRGLKITGHICATTYKEAADVGIDNLEHGFWAATDYMADKPKGQCVGGSRGGMTNNSPTEGVGSDLIDYMVQNQVAITSTLPVISKGSSVFTGFPENWGSVISDVDRARFDERRARFDNNPQWIEGSDKTLQAAVNYEMEFIKRGGLLVAGSDTTGMGGTLPGLANLEQIHLMVWGGFSLEQAIKVVSLNGAIYLEQQDNIGSITVGKDADLLLIDGDISADIRNVYKSEITFKHGIGYNSQRMIASSEKTVGGPGPN